MEKDLPRFSLGSLGMFFSDYRSCHIQDRRPGVSAQLRHDARVARGGQMIDVAVVYGSVSIRLMLDGTTRNIWKVRGRTPSKSRLARAVSIVVEIYACWKTGGAQPAWRLSG